MLGGPLGQGLGVVHGAAPTDGVLVAVDAPDTAAFVATAVTYGILNATDKQDRAIFFPIGALYGILDATDAEDTALFQGVGVTHGILSAVDQPDTALFRGAALWEPIFGILRASEAKDTAYFVVDRSSGIRVPSPVPQSPWDCLRHTPPRRRVFWTTQPEACGDYIMCGNPCSIPGLEYEETVDGRTIVTTEWLRSLILNILNTRARSDLACPTPMAVYGHWSESYREDGIYIGAKFWNAAEKNYIRIADGVKLISTTIQADLHKLIQLGVAKSIDVEANYRGNNTVIVTITATSVITGSMKLNLAGAFMSTGWEWR